MCCPRPLIDLISDTIPPRIANTSPPLRAMCFTKAKSPWAITIKILSASIPGRMIQCPHIALALLVIRDLRIRSRSVLLSCRMPYFKRLFAGGSFWKQSPEQPTENKQDTWFKGTILLVDRRFLRQVIPLTFKKIICHF